MDIGYKGENIFEGWCHDENLVPNESKIDKYGWDYIVDLPQNFRADLKTLDKDDSLDQIFVQVKTTKSEKGNRSIKLSNLKRLINSPLPSFYILIQLSDEGKPVNAYLFHVWSKIIGDVQRKLRLTKIDQWDKLHKIKLSLPWSEAQEFNKFHGKELIRLVKENIKSGQNEYARKKYEIKTKIGYEKESGRIELKGNLPDKYKNDADSFFVDLFLGEIEKVNLIEFSEIDTRFEHDIITKKREGGYVKISNIEPEGKALLIFSTKDHRSRIEFKAEYFIPRGIGDLVEKDKLKVLYKAPFIRFSLFLFSKRITYSFDIPNFNKETALTSLIDIAEIMLFLHEIDINESISFEIQNDGKPFIEGSLGFEKYTNAQSVQYFEAIKATSALMTYLKIDFDTTIKPTELIGQIDVLKYFQKLLSPQPLYMKVEFSLDTDLEDYEKTIALIPFTIKIGKFVVPIQISVQGNPEKTGEVKEGEIMYRLNSNYIRIEQYRKLSSENESSNYAHEEMNQILLKRYDVSEEIMVIHFDEIH